MKKTILVTIFIFIVAVSAFAAGSWRFGLEAGSPAVVLIGRYNNVIDLKLGYNMSGLLGGGETYFHFSADYRVIELNLIDFINLYAGVGAYIQFGSDSLFNLGARIPIGVNAYLAKGTFEIFAEMVPIVSFVPSPGFNIPGQGYIGFTVKLPNF